LARTSKTGESYSTYRKGKEIVSKSCFRKVFLVGVIVIVKKINISGGNSREGGCEE